MSINKITSFAVKNAQKPNNPLGLWNKYIFFSFCIGWKPILYLNSSKGTFLSYNGCTIEHLRQCSFNCIVKWLWLFPHRWIGLVWMCDAVCLCICPLDEQMIQIHINHGVQVLFWMCVLRHRGPLVSCHRKHGGGRGGREGGGGGGRKYF